MPRLQLRCLTGHVLDIHTHLGLLVFYGSRRPGGLDGGPQHGLLNELKAAGEGGANRLLDRSKGGVLHLYSIHLRHIGVSVIQIVHAVLQRLLVDQPLRPVVGAAQMIQTPRIMCYSMKAEVALSVLIELLRCRVLLARE